MGRPKDKSPGGGELLTPPSFRKQDSFKHQREGRVPPCNPRSLCTRRDVTDVLRHARNLRQRVGQRARAPPKAHVARKGATKRALSKISSNVMSLLLTFLLTFLLTLLLTLPPRERSSSHQSRSLTLLPRDGRIQFRGRIQPFRCPPLPGFGERKGVRGLWLWVKGLGVRAGLVRG